MKNNVAPDGFSNIIHDTYGPDEGEDKEKELIGTSSKFDPTNPIGWDVPGSSYLHVGRDHHLNRKEVGQLRDILSHWLETGELPKI